MRGREREQDVGVQRSMACCVSPHKSVVKNRIKQDTHVVNGEAVCVLAGKGVQVVLQDDVA